MSRRPWTHREAAPSCSNKVLKPRTARHDLQSQPRRRQWALGPCQGRRRRVHWSALAVERCPFSAPLRRAVTVRNIALARRGWYRRSHKAVRKVAQREKCKWNVCVDVPGVITAIVVCLCSRSSIYIYSHINIHHKRPAAPCTQRHSGLTTVKYHFSRPHRWRPPRARDASRTPSS